MAGTKAVKYVGPFAEGVDIHIDGRWVQAKPGEAIEVPDAVAASLVEQIGNWEAAKAAPPAKDSK